MQHFAKTTFALFVVLLASFASAQTLPPFQHIIIVVQENRTPDNIFGYWATSGGPLNCPLSTPTFTGADLVNWGNSSVNGGPICNVQQAMNNGGGATGFDPGHAYADWTADYDYNPQTGVGNMDGFCHEYTSAQCDGTNSAPTPYSYIKTSDVEPYYKIATTYGFANYMFQTNEGPSFVAHQFLFTGTSAPVAPGVGGQNGNWWYFVGDNPSGMGETNNSGCASQIDAPWVHPDGTEVEAPPNSYECYPHDSLVTTSDPNTGDVIDKISSWTYYSPLDGSQEQIAGPGYIWDAPEAIPEVCYGVNNTNSTADCGGTEWNNHMSFYSTMDASILQDITSCTLPSISWVIPDLAWSDHPSYDGTAAALGPSWVADIVNAVGNSSLGGRCDYWGTSSLSDVEPTAIFVVWDDWGGFYDHIQPYAYLRGSKDQQGNWTCGAPNSWGCGNTYGFRVPLLVASEWTGTGNSTTGYSGYISGPCTPPNCPNKTQIYQHDFGSILAFTENNFALSPQFIAFPYYADYNAPDWGNLRNNIPLSDFFGLWAGTGSTGRPFVQIQSNYGASFFNSYYANGGTPAAPDTD